MAFESIPARFFQWGERTPESPAYGVREPDNWVVTTWSAYCDQVRSFARALVGAGVGKGDRVCILGNNRPEWTIADMACLAIGAVSVGIYPTSSRSQIKYILSHAEPQLLVLEGEPDIERVAIEDLPDRARPRVVFMRPQAKDERPGVYSWSTFLSLGQAVEMSEIERRLASISPSDLGILVYTSGTTGYPKAVMLTHGNLAACTEMGLQMVGHETAGACVLSYLPLAHIAERGISVLGAASAGYAVYFAESIEMLPRNLREVRPHFFVGVPRLWEKMALHLTNAFEEAPRPARMLIAWSRSVARRVSANTCAGTSPDGQLAIAYRLADRLFLSRIKRKLGLDRARVLLTGAAPITVDLLTFFASLSLVVQEVYGLSETGGPVAFNRAGRTRFGTAGLPFEGVEVKLSNDGEILVRGENVFAGYYRDEAATLQVLQDGWLNTGDLGAIDGEGYITITGRQKEILITAGGKNVAPAMIERLLTAHELVANAVVVGDRRRYLVALLALDSKAVTRWRSRKAGVGVEEAVEHHVREVNKELSRVQSIKKYAIVERVFSVEQEEITPTQKLRRHVIEEHYRNEIERLYDEETAR